LREHWQLNCDIFGATHFSADVEIIALAHKLLIDFGAQKEQFKIRINHRGLIAKALKASAEKVGVKLSDEKISYIIRLIDKIDKLSSNEFESQMATIIGDDINEYLLDQLSLDKIVEASKVLPESEYLNNIINGLFELGIKATPDTSLARGFDYYTGTIFEIFEVDTDGNSTGRAMLGGGRYDNLTSMFGGEPISGIGFGMGDVTMRDFLETHHLIPEHIKSTGALVSVVPVTAEQNLAAQGVAMQIRQAGFSVSTDIGTQKTDKKKGRAADRGSSYIIIVGADEISAGTYILKNLSSGVEKSGSIPEIIHTLNS
jgi:histidyl-tRNA synthetase